MQIWILAVVKFVPCLSELLNVEASVSGTRLRCIMLQTCFSTGVCVNN